MVDATGKGVARGRGGAELWCLDESGARRHAGSRISVSVGEYGAADCNRSGVCAADLRFHGAEVVARGSTAHACSSSEGRASGAGMRTMRVGRHVPHFDVLEV